MTIRRQVVGGRLHVEQPDVAGQCEAVQRQRAGHGRAELGGPLVTVHRGVQAARLVEIHLGGPGRLQAVQPDRLGGEEAERVEVGAADRVLLDHLVGAGLTEAQRQRMPVLGPAVDHRPLVQAEAAGEDRAGGGRGEQSVDVADALAARLEVRLDVQCHDTVGVRPVPLPAGVLGRSVGGGGQAGADARVPAAQLGWPGAVVVVQEVLDRMLRAGRTARAVARGHGVGALGVSTGEWDPRHRRQRRGQHSPSVSSGCDNPLAPGVVRICAYFEVPVEVVFSLEPFPRLGADSAFRSA